MNNILIAEDEHLIARLIEMTLTRAGYTCTVAEDGRTAADLIEKNNFDMALLDIMLPGLDGYALLESLRPQGVPVIFITAKSAVKDRVLGLRLGADDYITKPFAAEELVARMESVLRRTGRGGRELRAYDVVLDTVDRVARQNGEPLAVLTDAGQQIAAGDYARRTALHTGDEIETLSASFDKMADAVQEKIADLEADVQKREDFVGAFTHELKTPMTSIIGYADILAAMQTDPDEQREAAAAIAHEGRRLESLSHKLLALLGLAECPLTPAAVPLAALWPRLHAACPGVNLRTPAAPAPTVQGDADLLLDLLCNLVQNAAKASKPGAPVVVLCTADADTATLTVADRGCGIPPDQLARVTEPFYMVDKSRARRQGGSGLGLALCQRIAAAHDGTLKIESEPGKGTRVSVTLPLWKKEADA